jgi:hypothetical protein
MITYRVGSFRQIDINMEFLIEVVEVGHATKKSKCWKDVT